MKAVAGTLPLPAGFWTAPPTPVANNTFAMNWNPVAGAIQYVVQIQNLFGWPVWPPGFGFAVVTVPTVTVGGGLPAGTYIVLLASVDQPWNLGDPDYWARTNGSLAFYVVTVQ